MAWLALFVAFLVAAAVMVARLWAEGTEAALNSTEGQLIEVITDPEQPGFEALLDPTPTLLIAHTDNGELIGVTVMARTAVEGGGHMILIGPNVLVEAVPGSGEGRFVNDAYIENGLGGVEEILGQMFGFGFVNAIEMSTPELGASLGLVQPIQMELLDDLGPEADSGSIEVWLERGITELDGPTAAEVYSHLGADEAEVNRQERQADLWQDWIDKIGTAADPDSAAAVSDRVLAAYLLAFSRGEVQVQTLPTRMAVFDDNKPFYVLDAEDLTWISELSEAIVPVPVPPAGESWPRIRLLDGTGSSATRDAALAALFDLEMQAVILGNADEFSVETSRVIHYEPDDAAEAAEDVVDDADAQAVVDATDAQAVADRLGIELEIAEGPDQAGILTVVIGTDWPLS